MARSKQCTQTVSVSVSVSLSLIFSLILFLSHHLSLSPSLSSNYLSLSFSLIISLCLSPSLSPSLSLCLSLSLSALTSGKHCVTQNTDENTAFGYTHKISARPACSTSIRLTALRLPNAVSVLHAPRALLPNQFCGNQASPRTAWAFHVHALRVRRD